LSDASLIAVVKMETELWTCRPPEEAWNTEMIETLNYSRCLKNRSDHHEIFLFQKHNDFAYLLNTKASHMEDSFTTANPGKPIFIMEDTTTATFHALFPKNKLVSV
jgi:hypothetical protein